ncbi:tRNA (cytosine(72)-C(5))-methyltransferase NSUN6-like isoform X2 [Patiria miniata]|uniref:SAM-dependent MTase RsmB/NOP-type domain-containing protein n=1 Tax=Patiria miniata TaxID=46514 RepID=A0A913Z1X4_PATMI|nr:tRNA (cytosine(72)-C(5))-methyltransferase NSUN6-like isoform X2 [Patiria miniata]
MASVMLPEVTFQLDVKEHLEKCFLNEKAIAQVGEDVCKERWTNLLTALSYPPACTVLRVSTLHHNMVEGDNVSVYVDVNGLCRRGLTKPFDGAKVFLGNGHVVMSRRELFVTNSEPRGVAVRLCEPVFDCPSLNGILTDRLFLQNLPSIVVGHVLNPVAGNRVLDMCAAPGGKTTHLASLMKDQGVLIALDKSQNKLNKVKQNARRLGLSCIQAFSYDSTKACSRDMVKLSNHDTEINAPPYPPETFDCILLDAPCSGLGQRPQICNQLQLSELKSYPAYQRKFLTTAVELLRPGGTLVYSTCTVTLAENEGMVEWILNTFPQLALSQQIPHLGGCGFEGTDLDVQHLSKLQRFHPVTSYTSASPTHCNLDTIGFFIAKFIKRMECEQTG